MFFFSWTNDRLLSREPSGLSFCTGISFVNTLGKTSVIRCHCAPEPVILSSRLIPCLPCTSRANNLICFLTLIFWFSHLISTLPPPPPHPPLSKLRGGVSAAKCFLQKKVQNLLTSCSEALESSVLRHFEWPHSPAPLCSSSPLITVSLLKLPLQLGRSDGSGLVLIIYCLSHRLPSAVFFSFLGIFAGKVVVGGAVP